MDIERLKIGQKVYVTPMDRNEQYISSVYDMDELGIYVPIPFSNNRPLVLSQEEQVRVRYMTEDGGFTFLTRAIGRKAEKNMLPMYIFSHPTETQIARFQLREFARVPVIIEVQYAIPPEHNEQPSFQKTFTVDLSGGGMKLVFKQPVSLGKMLLLNFNIVSKAKKKQQLMKLLAKVVRCELVDQEMSVYHVGLQFLDIRQPQQDLIMAFVFERMIDIKRLK